MLARSVRALSLIVLVAACGKPMDPSGQEDASFTKASMGFTPPATDASRPLAADLAVEPVSMLVMFNRLQTGEKLTEALNRKPGQFSRIDIDRDSAPDPLTAVKKDAPDGHAFEIHARAKDGDFVVATMMFDSEWAFLGHYNGVKDGAASTVGSPVKVPGSPAPLPTITPPAPAAPAPVAAVPTAAPPAVAAAPAPTAGVGSVQAVPAGSGVEAGVR